MYIFSEEMSRADYLVVDSGGFIKNAPLREIANHVVTLRDVVQEIRDKPTRQRLQVRESLSAFLSHSLYI